MAAVKKLTEDQQAFIDFASDSESEKKPNVPWYQNYPSALGKGALETTAQLGRMFGGLQPSPAVDASGKMTGELLGTPSQESDIDLQRQQLLNENLPTNKDFSTDVTERTGKLIPYTLGGTSSLPSKALQAISGAFAGQGAEKAGFGETGQAISEIAGMGIPALARFGIEATGALRPGFASQIPYKLLPTAVANEERVLIDFAREMGMTEQEMLPAIKTGSFGQRMLSTFSAKGAKLAEAIDATRDSLGRVWGFMRTRPEAQTAMTGQQSNRFINNLSQAMQDLPREMTARIQADYNDLLGSNMTGADLMNFWQDLNYYIGRGEARLGTLKEPIAQALRTISPELGADFELTNRLYRNSAQFAERMGPDILDRFLSTGEAGMAVQGVITGNLSLLQKALGLVGGRVLAREMLINPRLKNLSARFVNGIQRNSPAIAKKVYDLMLIEVGKNNAEAAMKMSKMDIMKLFDKEGEGEGQE